MRVLLVTHKSADGYPTARAEYCATGCGQAVTADTVQRCGHPLFLSDVTGVSLYQHADGSTEAHEWVDRRAVICCGAGCVQQMGRSA